MGKCSPCVDHFVNLWWLGGAGVKSDGIESIRWEKLKVGKEAVLSGFDSMVDSPTLDE